MKESKLLHFPDLEKQESLTVENQLKFYHDEKDISLRKRITFAFMLDVMLISVLNIGINVAFVSFINEFLIPLNFIQKMSLSSLDLITSFSIYFTVLAGYFTFFPMVLAGKTPGKVWMKISVITNSFKNDIDQLVDSLDLSHIVKRTTGYMSFYLSFGITYFMSVFDPDKKTLAEHFSDTEIVSDFWLEKQLYFRALHSEQVEIEIDSLDIKIAS